MIIKEYIPTSGERRRRGAAVPAFKLGSGGGGAYSSLPLPIPREEKEFLRRTARD